MFTTVSYFIKISALDFAGYVIFLLVIFLQFVERKRRFKLTVDPDIPVKGPASLNYTGPR
jgi:hypothetical protein